MSQWPVEDIPDEDILYRCVHRRAFDPDGELTSAAFNDDGTGISVDWGRYSTPTQSRDRRKFPEENAAYELRAQEIRQTRRYPGSLHVCHTPDPIGMNRAHASIIGFHGMEKARKMAVREELLELLNGRGPIIPL